MLYAGLDLSRKRLEFHLLHADGRTVELGASPPDADGLSEPEREPATTGDRGILVRLPRAAQGSKQLRGGGGRNLRPAPSC